MSSDSTNSKSPDSTDSTNISISEGHVGLVLLTDGDSSFYLEIPLVAINANSLDAAKYLLFVGWCVMGAEGLLSLQPDGEELDVDIEEEGIYYYLCQRSRCVLLVMALRTCSTLTLQDAMQAVDLEVIKMGTQLSSETTRTREDFHTKLLERDVFCAWTGIGEDFGSGVHIYYSL